MTQTTQGTGPGAASNVFPALYNGRVKLANLTKEVTDSVNGYPQVNIGDTNHELELTDAGKHIYATDCIVTIPYTDDVPFPIGTQIIIVAQGLDVVVDKAGGGTMLYLGGSDVNTCTISARSTANLLKTAVEEWYISGDNVS